MAEMYSIDRERLQHLERIVEAMYRCLVNQVIADIKALRENCRLSGDDSGLEDVWEEFKSQMQGQHSIYFAAYEHTILGLCLQRLGSLGPERQAILWLWSRAFYDWLEDDMPASNTIQAGVLDEVYDRVCGTANDEPLAKELDDPEPAEDE